MERRTLLQALSLAPVGILLPAAAQATAVDTKSFELPTDFDQLRKRCRQFYQLSRDAGELVDRHVEATLKAGLSPLMKEHVKLYFIDGEVWYKSYRVKHRQTRVFCSADERHTPGACQLANLQSPYDKHGTSILQPYLRQLDLAEKCREAGIESDSSIFYEGPLFEEVIRTRALHAFQKFTDVLLFRNWHTLYVGPGIPNRAVQ